MKAKGYNLADENTVPENARSRLLVTPQTQQLAKPNQAFREEDFVSYAKLGTAIIRGQAFMKTRAGDVKLGAGNTVLLCPVTTYTTEYFSRMIVGREQMEPPDPRLEKYFKSTIANSTGEFEFAGLAGGDYYIGCKIAWEYSTPQGLVPTGGIAYAKVRVEDGKIVSAIVTR